MTHPHPHPSLLLANAKLYSEASLLREYENDNDITFAALENKKLRELAQIDQADPRSELEIEDDEDLDEYERRVTQAELARLYEFRAIAADLLGLVE